MVLSEIFFFSVLVLIDNINKAVSCENTETLITLLKNPVLKLPIALHKEEYPLCMRTLKKSSHQKESKNLWYEDILHAINEVHSESLKVKQLTDAIVQLNIAIFKNNINDFWNTLCNPVLSVSENIEEECLEAYFQMFAKALKKRSHYICPWIVCHTDAGNTVYIDIESYNYSWTTPKDFSPYPRYLTKKDVCAIIEKTNKHEFNSQKQRLSERTIIRFQAHCRGFLVRQATRRERLYRHNEGSVVKIQAWWRRILIQKKYGTLIKMKTIEAQLKQERKRNPWVWYKVQVRKYINWPKR